MNHESEALLEQPVCDIRIDATCDDHYLANHGSSRSSGEQTSAAQAGRDRAAEDKQEGAAESHSRKTVLDCLTNAHVMSPSVSAWNVRT